MKDRQRNLEWVVFALIALCYCFLLSARPIPSILDENDTGRYVSDLNRYCSGTFFDDLLNKELSYQFFYLVNSAACWTNSANVFLFQVAAFLPLTFLLFSKWHKATIVWAFALLCSVYGLELTTNAMRQGFGMFLFFGALSIVQRHPMRAILLGFLAGVAHTSVMAFLPMLLWISCIDLSKKALVRNGIFISTLAAIWIYSYQSQVLGALAEAGELQTTYGLFYEEELKPRFIVFMALPLYLIYGLRRYYEKQSISQAENIAIVYSTGVMIISFVLFQYITFRFAIFAVVMQIFLVTISSGHTIKVGSRIAIGFLAHLLFMIFVTDHFDVLVNG